MKIPSSLLNRLYNEGSLKNANAGPEFALENRLGDVQVVALRSIAIDGAAIALGDVQLDLGDERVIAPADVDAAHPLPFPLRASVKVRTHGDALRQGKHEIEISFDAQPFGNVQLKVEDAIDGDGARMQIPRDAADDYSPGIIELRRAAIERISGFKLEHCLHYSFDPHMVKGNCESFVGVAQVPIGFVGPLRVCGEFAQGDYLVPLATSEGTLIASYNRGMKVLNLSGGVKVTVVADAMQRAPVFIFQDARAARDFVKWIEANLSGIRSAAEATSRIAKLQYIDPFVASKFVYLRFNYSTGDGAGQNMVSRATYAACNWILEHADGIVTFCLESNFATDKKASSINMMRTRGKRVTAEATIPRDILIQHLGMAPDALVHHYGVANIGAFLSGANNNGLQSANGIAAIFIATGQDVANVAESSAGIFYAELTPTADLYVSITIPSLIVATYGGGTSLATQRECLEVMDCFGTGKVNRLAEIIGGVTLAGEISLAGAISNKDWISSHERFGRNR